MAKGIQFYRRTPGVGLGSTLIEEAELGEFGVTDGAVTIAVANLRKCSPAMLVAEIEYNGRPIGRLSLIDWLNQNPPGPWRWFVDPAEMARVEDVRSGSDLTLSIRGTGIGEITNTDDKSENCGLVFGNYVTVPHSTWERILTQLKYQPAIAVTLPKTLAHWPEWAQVIGESQDAVRALSRGETHAALRSCLGLLEKLHAAPYTPESWGGFFDVDGSKEAGLKALIAGVGTYLNKVGHHRSRTDRDAKGDLLQSPVDHYEAEILVAMTQLLLAYIKRLPHKKSAAVKSRD